ncbi:MAG: hypothetical protein JXR10_05690 [Cyclobacteriaceae bacterium]
MIDNNLTKSICAVFFLILFTACEFEIIIKELKPQTYKYGSVFLDNSIPSHLILKSETNEHAKHVYDRLVEVQNRFVEWNTSIDSILYEIEILSVLDPTNSMGVDWLPYNAESKGNDHYIWRSPDYQAKFYQSIVTRGGLVEMGLDNDYQYIYWYKIEGSYGGGNGPLMAVTELRQSLDSTSGSIVIRHSIEGKYCTQDSTVWELSNNKLTYSFLGPDQCALNVGIPGLNKPHNNQALTFDLGIKGNGLLNYLDDCADRYFWDKDGNGVYEQRIIKRVNDRCDLEITRW